MEVSLREASGVPNLTGLRATVIVVVRRHCTIFPDLEAMDVLPGDVLQNMHTMERQVFTCQSTTIRMVVGTSPETDN